MSTRLVGWAIHLAHPQVDSAGAMVLVVLADHAGTDGIAWPGLDRLAELAGCSRDTVRRRLLLLHELGLIAPAHPDHLPHAWQALRPDRRPVAYAVGPEAVHQLSSTAQPQLPDTPAATPTRSHTATPTRSQPATPTRSQPATPQEAHGVADSNERGSRQQRHGVAACYPNQEQNQEQEPSGVTYVGDLPRAAARDEPPQALARGRPEQPPPAPPGSGPADRHPSAVIPCRMCRNVHPPDTPHPRRQPPEVAQRGAARARAALRGGSAAAGDP
jgi:hypothetical protein